MPKYCLGFKSRFLSLKRKTSQGSIDPLSLFGFGFLIVSIFVGIYAVSKSNIKFDIRNRADVGMPEYGTTVPQNTTAPTPYCNRSCSIYEKCVADLNGGRCEIKETQPSPVPTAYCSGQTSRDCLYGCTPDLYGGKCKTKPVTIGSVAPIPTIRPTITPIPTQSTYTNPESYGCSQCNCSGFSTCPYGGQIQCQPPSSCSQQSNPAPVPTAYCSGQTSRDCLYGCKPDIYGGSCNTKSSSPTTNPLQNFFIGLGGDISKILIDLGLKELEEVLDVEEINNLSLENENSTEAYCSGYNSRACIWGCIPDFNGGKCKTNSLTPVATSKLTIGSGTGQSCGECINEKMSCTNLSSGLTSTYFCANTNINVPTTSQQPEEKVDEFIFDLATLDDGKKWCSGDRKPGEVVIWGGKIQGCNGSDGKWIPLSDYGFTPDILTVKPVWLTEDSKTWLALDLLASNNNATFNEDGTLKTASTVVKQAWCNTDSGGVSSGNVSQGGISGYDRSRCEDGHWVGCSKDPNSKDYCKLTIVPSWYNAKDLNLELETYNNLAQEVETVFGNEYDKCVSSGKENCLDTVKNLLLAQGKNANIVDGVKASYEASSSLFSNYYPVYENYIKECATDSLNTECLNYKAQLNRTLAQTGLGNYFTIETVNENFASYLFEKTASEFISLKQKYENNCLKGRTQINGIQYKECFGSGGIEERIKEITSSSVFKYFEARANYDSCDSNNCSYWANQIAILEKDEQVKVLLTETNADTKYQSITSYWDNLVYEGTQEQVEQQKEDQNLLIAAINNDYSSLKEACSDLYSVSLCSRDQLILYGQNILIEYSKQLPTDLQASILDQVDSYSPLEKCAYTASSSHGAQSSCTCSAGYYNNSGLCVPTSGNSTTSTLSQQEKDSLLANIVQNQLICSSSIQGSYQSTTGLCVKETAGEVPIVISFGREAYNSSECTSKEVYKSGKCVMNDKVAVSIAVGTEGNCANGYRNSSAISLSNNCVPVLSKESDNFVNRFIADNFTITTTPNFESVVVKAVTSFVNKGIQAHCSNSARSGSGGGIVNCNSIQTIPLLVLSGGNIVNSEQNTLGITVDKPWGNNTDQVVNNIMVQSIYDLASSTPGLVPQNYLDKNFNVEIEKLKKDGFYEAISEHTDALVKAQVRETPFGGFLKSIFNPGYVDSEQILAAGYSWMYEYSKSLNNGVSDFRPVINYNPLFVVSDDNQVNQASKLSTSTTGSTIFEIAFNALATIVSPAQSIIPGISLSDLSHLLYKSITGNSNPDNLEYQKDLIVGNNPNSLKSAFEKLGIGFNPAVDSYSDWVTNNGSMVDSDKELIFSISSQQVNNYLDTAREKPGYIVAPLVQNTVSFAAGVLSNIFLSGNIPASVAVQAGADVITQQAIDLATYTVFERITDALSEASDKREIAPNWSQIAIDSRSSYEIQEFAMNLGTSLVFNAAGEFVGRGIADNLLVKSLTPNTEYAEAVTKGLIVNNIDEITQEMAESSSKFIGVTSKGNLLTFATKAELQEAIQFNQFVKIALINSQIEQSSKELVSSTMNDLSRFLFSVSPKEASEELAERLNVTFGKNASDVFLSLTEPSNYIAQGGKNPGILWIESLVNKNKPVERTIAEDVIRNTDSIRLVNGELTDVQKLANEGKYLIFADNTGNIIWAGKASDLTEVKITADTLVQISDNPFTKQVGILSSSTLANFSQVDRIVSPNYIRTLNGKVLTAFKDINEVNVGALNRGNIVEVVTDGRSNKYIVNSLGGLEKLDPVASLLSGGSKNIVNAIDPNSGKFSFSKLFESSLPSTKGSGLKNLALHVESLQEEAIKGGSVDDVVKKITGFGTSEYKELTGNIVYTDLAGKNQNIIFRSSDDLISKAPELEGIQKFSIVTKDGNIKMFVSDGAGLSSYHERVLPEIISKSVDGKKVFRIKIPENASSSLTKEINDFNNLVTRFEKGFGNPLRQEQIQLLTSPENLYQLGAGGGKTSVVAPMVGAIERNSVLTFADSTTAKEAAQNIGGLKAFYDGEGIETLYYSNNKNAFLKIVGKDFDPETAEVIDMDSVWKIVNKASDSPSKNGLMIVTQDSDNAWAIIRSKAKSGDPASDLLYNLVLRTKSGGKGYTLVVDEIGQVVNGRFSVAFGDEVLIRNLSDKTALQGLDSADDILRFTNEVKNSEYSTIFRNKLKDQISLIRQQDCINNPGCKEVVDDLFFVHVDENGIKQFQPIPKDINITSNSYADIVDQTLENPLLAEDSSIRTQLTDISAKLRSATDDTYESVQKEFFSILGTPADQIDGDLAINNKILSELSFRKKYLEAEWSVMSGVPGNSYGLESVDGQGIIVLRERGGTTGKEYSDIFHKMALQNEAPDLLESAGYTVDRSKLKTVGDLVFTPDSNQITNKEIYQDIAEKYIGFDATPDTAANTLGTKATAVSERPPKPNVLITSKSQDKLIADGIQEQIKNGKYFGKTQAIVNIDNGVTYEVTTNGFIKGYSDVEVIARTKFYTNPEGDEATEYFFENVVRNSDGTITRTPIKEVSSMDDWNSTIREYLEGENKPESLMIVYEGRGRAADLKPNLGHKNMSWSIFTDDTANMEDLTQAVKRNRVFGLQNELLDQGWNDLEIENATKYNLLVRTDNTNLNVDNVVNFYEKVLQNDLAKSNIETRILRIANSQTTALESIKDQLISNLPSSRKDWGISLFDILINDAKRVGTQQVSEITRKPLAGEEIAVEVWSRGSVSYNNLERTFANISREFNLSSSEIIKFKTSLGIDKGYIIKHSFLELWKSPVKNVIYSNPQGINQEVLYFAQTTSPDRMPSAIFLAKSQPDTLKIAQATQDKTSKTQRTTLASQVSKTVNVITNTKTAKYIVSRPKVWLAGMVDSAKIVRQSFSNIFQPKENKVVTETKTTKIATTFNLQNLPTLKDVGGGIVVAYDLSKNIIDKAYDSFVNIITKKGTTNVPGTKVTTIQKDTVSQKLVDKTLGKIDNLIEISVPRNQIELHNSSYNGITLTVNNLYSSGLQPKYSFNLEGKQILLSNPYQIKGGRVAFVVYVKKDGSDNYIARSYYRSNSSSSWRYLPGYDVRENGSTWYSKGYSEEGINATVSLQGLMSNILQRVKPLEIKSPANIFLGLSRPRKVSITSTYYFEIGEIPEEISLNKSYLQGKELPRPEYLSPANKEDEPDFTKQLASWTEQTPIYGKIVKDAFPSKNNKYIYVFYRDKAGRAGIAFIENHSKITSLGIRETWVKAGPLLTPIMEYSKQSGGYGNYKIVSGSYIDMYQNYLSKIPIIQDYQKYIKNNVNKKIITSTISTIKTTNVDLFQRIAKILFTGVIGTALTFLIGLNTLINPNVGIAINEAVKKEIAKPAIIENYVSKYDAKTELEPVVVDIDQKVEDQVEASYPTLNIVEDFGIEGVETVEELNRFSDEDLYKNYYEPSPNAFIGSGTRYGSQEYAEGEVLGYGGVIRQQMGRGYALLASGQYGYHPELKEELLQYPENSVWGKNKDPNDTLLDNQASTIYFYLSEKNWINGEFVAVNYNDLNENQKRIFDLTKSKSKIGSFFTSIDIQSKMTVEEALDSGKYIGIISTKSPNDIGRRFVMYQRQNDGTDKFLGIVLVGGTAARADWTGREGSIIKNNPLGIRRQNPETSKSDPNGQQWGFDLPNHIYEYFGGSGGPVFNIVVIDPDKTTFDFSEDVDLTSSEVKTDSEVETEKQVQQDSQKVSGQFDKNYISKIYFGGSGVQPSYRYVNNKNPYENIPSQFYKDEILNKFQNSKYLSFSTPKEGEEILNNIVIVNPDGDTKLGVAEIANYNFQKNINLVDLPDEYTFLAAIDRDPLNLKVAEEDLSQIKDFVNDIKSQGYYFSIRDTTRTIGEQADSTDPYFSAKPGRSGHETYHSFDYLSDMPTSKIKETARKYAIAMLYPKDILHLTVIDPLVYQAIEESGLDPQNNDNINGFYLGISQAIEAKIDYLKKYGTVTQSNSVESDTDLLASNEQKSLVDKVYDQNDYPNVYVGDDVTLKDVGCGVITVANIVKKDPMEVLSLYTIGKDISAAGSTIKAHAKALRHYKYDVNTGVKGEGVLTEIISKANATNDYDLLLSELDKYLKAKKIIMLNVNSSNLGGQGHWVVLTSVDTTKRIIKVIDPNGGKADAVYSFDISASDGEGENKFAPKKVLVATEPKNKSSYMNATIIPFLTAETFEKLSEKYIYSEWPEAREKGILPVLYQNIKKIIESKKKNKAIIPVTGDLNSNNLPIEQNNVILTNEFVVNVNNKLQEILDRSAGFEVFKKGTLFDIRQFIFENLKDEIEVTNEEVEAYLFTISNLEAKKNTTGYKINQKIQDFKKEVKQPLSEVISESNIEYKEIYTIPGEKSGGNKFNLEQSEREYISRNISELIEYFYLPQNYQINDTRDIIAALNIKYPNPNSETARFMARLVNILYTAKAYPSSVWGILIRNFVDNGSDINKIPSLLANIYTENYIRYLNRKIFIDDSIDLFNSEYVTKVNEIYSKSGKEFKAISPEDIVWITDYELGSSCVSGFCNYSTPFYDTHHQYFAVRYANDWFIDYSSGRTASSVRDGLLHSFLHESIHANYYHSTGTHFDTDTSNVYKSTTEQLTETLTKNIEEKISKENLGIYLNKSYNYFGFYFNEYIFSELIIDALGINVEDMYEFSINQDPIGYMNFIDKKLSLLSNEQYASFIKYISNYDNSIKGLKPLSNIQADYLIDNRVNSIIDILNLYGTVASTWDPDNGIFVKDPLYIPEKYYSQTVEGKYILKLNRGNQENSNKSIKYLGSGINWPESAKMWREAESKATNNIVKKIFGFSASVAEFIDSLTFKNSIDLIKKGYQSIKDKITKNKIIPVTGSLLPSLRDFENKLAKTNIFKTFLTKEEAEKEILKDVQTPITQNKIDEVKLNNWVNAHQGEARDVVEVIAKNINWVSFNEFKEQLKKVTLAFKEKIGDKKYAIVINTGEEKSDKWVISLIKNELPKNYEIVLGSSSSIKNFVLENPDIKDFLFIDDASYSGSQMGNIVDTLYEKLREVNKKVNTYLVIPYMTEYAYSRIIEGRSADQKQYLNFIPLADKPFDIYKKMKTLEEVFADDPSVTTDGAALLYRANRMYKTRNTTSSRALTLIYFEHKVPDDFSFSDYVKNGRVVNPDGTEVKKNGRNLLIPFIPYTKEPYKSEYEVYKAINGYIEDNMPNMNNNEKIWLASETQELYDVVYQRIAPLYANFAEYLLGLLLDSERGTKLVFMARDGLPYYESLVSLIEKDTDLSNPEARASIDAIKEKIVYANLNQSILDNTPKDLLEDYFTQLGVTKDDKLVFVDIGFYGSIIDSLKAKFKDYQIKDFQFFISKTSRATGYLNEVNNMTLESFSTGISGNSSVHFLEDTFSGVQQSAHKLIRNENGVIEPDSLEKGYPADISLKREIALFAVRECLKNNAYNKIDSYKIKYLDEYLMGEYPSYPESTESIIKVPHEQSGSPMKDIPIAPSIENYLNLDINNKNLINYNIPDILISDILLGKNLTQWVKDTLYDKEKNNNANFGKTSYNSYNHLSLFN